jgi:glycosyltransferase involved in cell wall biosynthesis
MFPSLLKFMRLAQQIPWLCSDEPAISFVLAILTTHPIQYQVPLWRELAGRGEMPLEVWYLSDQGYRNSFDRGFGKTFSWDVDMLAGYNHRFLETRPRRAEINRFRGARIGSLLPLFKELGVEALLINGWHPQAYWQATFQAHRAGIPVLLRAETNDLRRVSRMKELIRRPLLNSLFRRIRVFLTIGKANRRFYQSYGVRENKLVDSPYCVDNNRFSEAARMLRPQRNEIRDAWGIRQDAVCFLFAGKLIDKKHPLDAIQAVDLSLREQTVSAAKQPIHLLIVGDGALRGSCEERANEIVRNDGSRSVTFTGFLNQSEMPRAYVASDCLVLPSDAGETWGLVVNEAMACGLPAIVSDQVGCGSDLIDPGLTGDVFPMGDTQSLAVAMTAWADAARCRDSSKAVLRKIGAYSVERAADGVMEAIRGL